MATKESLFMVFSLFAMFLGVTSLPTEKGKQVTTSAVIVLRVSTYGKQKEF